MTPQDTAGHIERLKARFKELESRLSDSSVYANPSEFKKISREHQKLTALFQTHSRWTSAVEELESSRQLAGTEKDPEMRELAESEVVRLTAETAALETKILAGLVPPDPNDARNIIMEIRPGAGGEEASLFAGELYRSYAKYAERKGWKCETLELSSSDLGGIKEVVFSLSGGDVHSRVKYESGVHRVQRVPKTETSGRIHTSTITVAVLPEVEDTGEIELKTEDLRFDVFRSSGPGGQCVNTTDSAVRVTHIPTGLSVASQQEKSQHRNKDIALRILRARLLERKQREEQAKLAASKRAQIGTGDRSERIRTYNFPQNRVTDHRFGVSMHDLPSLMEGGFDSILEEILAIDSKRRLEEALKE
jgi:peptide chain release factor 1